MDPRWDCSYPCRRTCGRERISAVKITLRTIRLLAVAALVATVVGVASTSAAQGPPEGFTLPSQAAEVAPGVFFLGTAVEHGIPVVGYAYAHHRNGHNGGPGGGGDPEPTPPDASSCYSFIANGAHWRSAEDVVVDPATVSGLGVLISQVEAWMRAWEDQSTVSGIYRDFGSGTGLSADTTSTDGTNEVYFDTIADPGVLGYTIVWSTRTGPPRSRGIVEADIVVEDGEWAWWTGGGTIGPAQLDLGAVFRHEAGHYIGLGHTNQTTECAEQTMYPSLASGDASKQSLGVGDIAGVEDLHN